MSGSAVLATSAGPSASVACATPHSGLRNGFRPRHVQTGEGELRIEVPQARGSVVPFVSKLFPKWHCKRLLRTDPLKALVVGGFVRGLSMRDVESLCGEAGLGKTSRSTIARICAELHERFEAFCHRSLYDVNLVVLFLDAIYLPVRASGPKEGVVCAWGIDENGARQLVSVRLGARESKEDWVELGRDLIARGLAAPRMVVADGAPGLISAVEEIWPRADRQHSCRSPSPPTCSRRCPRKSTTGSVSTTGQRSPTRRARRTASCASECSSPSSSIAATSPPLAASPTTSTGWSCICAIRSATASGGVATNLLERSLGEVRRRTKVMGRFPGETSCLSLVWAVLDLFISHASNGATFTDLDRQHLYRIKYQQADPDALDEEVTAA